jgi:hypothetical protein
MALPYVNTPGRYRFLGISRSVPAEVNPKCFSVQHLQVTVYRSLAAFLGEPFLLGFQCCLPLLTFFTAWADGQMSMRFAPFISGNV